jgi:nucleoid-associated protein YgaU
MAINKAQAASELLGVGTGGGELAKLTIMYEGSSAKTPGRIEALFNPTEISLSKSVRWSQKRVASQGGSGVWSDNEQEFREVEAETLSIELFFDTYEPHSNDLTLKRAVTSLVTPTHPFQSSGATDVRKYTRQIAELAKVNRELHRPPICRLMWGKHDIFQGVLTALAQKFTLFLADGTPVRATLTCSFIEFYTFAHYRARERHSADVAKTRTVRRNDTLHSLAAEEYNDPGLWRYIAKANGIVHPRQLQPGTVLIIPKLRP